MAKVAYVRVSSQTQNIDRQVFALQDLGMEKIFIEKISGKCIDRPQLQKVLEYIREDDVLYIESISRLGRSVKDLLEIVDILNLKGVGLISLKENFINTTSPQGKLIFNIFASLSEFERESLRQRQKEGIEIARSKGAYKGRKKIEIEYDDRFKNLFKDWKNGHITAIKFMKLLNLKSNTFYRRIKEYKD